MMILLQYPAYTGAGNIELRWIIYVRGWRHTGEKIPGMNRNA